MINEQLKKIIELEKLKIEREEIDRLEERINKNIHLANDSRDKIVADNADLLRMRRKEGRQLVIYDED